jgi:YbbR domain-containing protein
MAGFFRKNLGLKLLSLLIAVSLEVYFMSPQNLVTETYSVKVELDELPPDFRVVWPPTATDGLVVAVRVKGPVPLIQELRNAQRKLKVSFPVKPPPVYLAELDTTQLRLPSGVELLELQPTKLEFRVERIIEREVKVRLNFTGQLPSGYRLEGYKIEPEAVIVRGPENEVLLIDELETESLDLRQIKQSAQVDVSIRSPAGQSELRRRSVRAILAVQLPQGERSFSDLAFEVTAPDEIEVRSVSPKTIKVSLSGEERLLKGISTPTVSGAVVANPSRIVGKVYRERVSLSVEHLPAGVKVEMISPERVEVTLVRRKR